MDEDYVGICFVENVTESEHHARSNVVQILTLFHNVKGVIRFYIEDVENLVEHLTMLGGNTY